MVRAGGPELDDVAARDRVLKELAQASGGDYHFEELPRLAVRPSREVRVGRQETVELWSRPPLLLLGLGAPGARVDPPPPLGPRLTRPESHAGQTAPSARRDGRAPQGRLGESARRAAPAAAGERPTKSSSIASDGIDPGGAERAARHGATDGARRRRPAVGGSGRPAGAKTASVATVVWPALSAAVTVMVWLPSIPVRSHS